MEVKVNNKDKYNKIMEILLLKLKLNNYKLNDKYFKLLILSYYIKYLYVLVVIFLKLFIAYLITIINKLFYHIHYHYM